MKKFLLNNQENGFTLIEALVAISIFSVSVVVLMSLLNQNVTGIRFAKEKIVSVYLAQEGIEYVRNIRDTFALFGGETGNSWSTFQSKVSMCATNDCGIDVSLLPTDSDAVFLCGSDNCKIYIDDGDYNVDSRGVISGFTRKIRVNIVNENEIKIISTVNFTKGKNSFNTVLTEEIFNWIE